MEEAEVEGGRVHISSQGLRSRVGFRGLWGSDCGARVLQRRHFGIYMPRFGRCKTSATVALSDRGVQKQQLIVTDCTHNRSDGVVSVLLYPSFDRQGSLVPLLPDDDRGTRLLA